MALAVSASTTGSMTPPNVQVVVSGLTIGDSYTVTGQWSGGSWAVRGGDREAVTSQEVLTDVAAPINTPVTYEVTSGGLSVTSAAVTVPWVDSYESAYLLASADGQVVVSFLGVDTGDEREYGMRSQVYQVAGRTLPVVVYDLATEGSGAWQVITDGAQTANMRDLLRRGGVALLRTTGSVRDMPATQYVAITSATSALLGMSSSRRWSLGYQVISDPQPDEVIPTSTWDDFDAAYSGLTWNSFDTEWSGLSWDLFDRTDWTTH